MKKIILEILQNEILSLQCVYLFGSYAEGNSTKESDIDVAFLASETVDNVTRFSIAQDLALQLGKSVDLVDLSRSSEVFNMQVVSKGECLFNSGATDFEDSVFYKYIDLNEQRSAILDDVKESGVIYG